MKERVKDVVAYTVVLSSAGLVVWVVVGMAQMFQLSLRVIGEILLLMVLAVVVRVVWDIALDWAVERLKASRKR